MNMYQNDTLFQDGQIIRIPKGLIYDRNNDTIEARATYKVKVVGDVRPGDKYVQWSGEKGKLSRACVEDVLASAS